jgi:hypothetical protein
VKDRKKTSQENSNQKREAVDILYQIKINFHKKLKETKKDII